MISETIHLRKIAYARSGDKGSNSNIGVIAYTAEGYTFLEKYLTAEKVADFFESLIPGKVIRFELPNLWALNFILEGVLNGGGTRSLRLDAQGKALGQVLLEMPIVIPEDQLYLMYRNNP
ncbi:MAG: hypothetical protein H0X29_08675 [Parachlamydiaceae bacterium]|nr:hypothetical protein [Parachlamydiaceae bacterium]